MHNLAGFQREASNSTLYTQHHRTYGIVVLLFSRYKFIMYFLQRGKEALIEKGKASHNIYDHVKNAVACFGMVESNKLSYTKK